MEMLAGASMTPLNPKSEIFDRCFDEAGSDSDVPHRSALEIVILVGKPQGKTPNDDNK